MTPIIWLLSALLSLAGGWVFLALLSSGRHRYLQFKSTFRNRQLVRERTKEFYLNQRARHLDIIEAEIRSGALLDWVAKL